MADSPEMDIAKMMNQAKARIDEMNQAAEELTQELGLPPEAKFDVLSIVYRLEHDQYEWRKHPMDTTEDIAEQVPSFEGRQIGHYHIIRELGRGRWGRVYLGRNIHLGTLAAIKVLLPLSTDEEKEKFREEARIIASLDHPNIVRVWDFGVEDGTPYLVMGYAVGGTLREHYSAGSKLPQERVAFYIEQIAGALQYAHNRGIIHRDVKPENILLNRDDQPLLSDFGIATIIQSPSHQALVARAETITTYIAPEPLQSQTRLETVAGTFPYMAPEQFDGKASPASDQYSLGILAYELLSGTRPFNGTPNELLFQHAVAAPPPLRDRIPNIPHGVEQVVLKALAKDPTRRYENVKAYAKALKEIPSVPPPLVEDIPVGPVIGVLNSDRPQPVRNWHKLWLVPVTLLMLVLLSLFSWLALVQHPNLSTNNGRSTAMTSPSSSSQHTAVFQTSNGTFVGITDGILAFDSDRADGHLKAEAAQALRAGNSRAADAYWNLAIAEDRTDAEAHIYQENQSVLESSSPYITFVVITTLPKDKYALNVGRDILQGAYIAQEEYNANQKLPGDVQVRLFIANVGDSLTDAMTVAQQIVQARQTDKTIVGVMGWPFGSDIEAIKYLATNHIPIVSPTVSSDTLTGISSQYFFSVAPSINSEAIAGAKFAEQTLDATKVALFSDPADPYSSKLATDFRQQFAEVDGNTIIPMGYTTGHPEALPGLVHSVMSGNPDLTLIYFAGYPEDARILLQDVHGSWPQLQVMGGDALYQLIHSPDSERHDFDGLYMTAFAYPDEWKVLGTSEPPFFTEYSQTFDPLRQHIGNPYGRTRADNDVILSYDAMFTLLHASSTDLTGKKPSLTPQDLQQALTEITGSQSLQGASGQISFGPDGNPQNKAVIVLYVAPKGIQFVQIQEGRYR